MIESEDIKRSQLLETILDSSPNCIYMKDKQGKYILANKTIADLYQTTPDEMIGKKDEDFADQAILKPNEAAFFKDIDKKAIETKETQTIPCESFTYEDGTIHYFFTTKTPITCQDDPDCVMGISVDITKLKETEKQASENESKFQDIFNKSTTGYALTKPDGTLSEVNNAFASMLGYTVEELSQMNFEEITHPDDMAKSKECVKTLLSGAQDSYRLEKRYYHKNGSIVWTNVSTTIMKDNAGNPLFFITSIQNITEKKDSSEKLKQSEKKFKTLFNSSSDALFIHSLADEKIIDVNEETLKRYGYTKNEILGLTVDDLSDISINSTKSKETQQLYQKLLDGETIQTDWRSKKKNGETFWHQMTLKIVTIDGEKRLLAQAKDIDEMVNSRNKLAESERKYRSYIDNAPNGVFICDEKGRYLEVNDKAVETTGYSKDELLTMSINDTIPDENKELGLQHFQNLLNEGKSFGEAPFVHKNGTVRWWQVNAVKLSENRFLGFTQDITNQKKIELELIKAKQRLEDAEKTARIGNVEWYVKEEKGYWSDVIFELYERDPSLGVPSFDEIMGFHHPDDAKKLEEAVSQAITKGIAYGVDLRTKLPSGKESIYHAIGIPIRNETGEISSIKGTVQDITEVKRTEIELRNNERKFRTIVEHANDGIALLDSTGVILDVNQRAVDIFGGMKDKLIGQRFGQISIISENDVSMVKAQFNRILQGKGKPGDLWLTNKKGERLCIEGTGSVFENETGEKRIVVIVRDITEKKNAEQALQAKEKRFRNLAELLPAAVVETDSDMQITFANNHAFKLMNYTKKDYKQGVNALEMFPPDEHERVKKNLSKRMAGKHLGTVEYQALNRNGEQFPVLVHADPIMKDGVFQGLRAVIVDITKIKEYREKLESLNNKLEQRVADRTQRIHQLLQQKDEFINQLGHDLKNPLGPLTQLLPLVEKHVDDPKYKDMLQVAIRNTRYMKQLVTKTIQLAQLKSPNTELNYELLNLSDEVSNIVETNKMMFEKNQIRIQNNLSKNLPINADKLKIHEVFHNLLNNAVKYTDEKPGFITIDSNIKDDDVIVISIKDSGIGMTAEQIEKAFDEFYKADSSRHDFDSSGLGMPICKRIVEMHGGKIWVESEGLGKGSTFYFTLKINGKGEKSNENNSNV